MASTQQMSVASLMHLWQPEVLQTLPNVPWEQGMGLTHTSPIENHWLWSDYKKYIFPIGDGEIRAEKLFLSVSLPYLNYILYDQLKQELGGRIG